jgi:hypothetical protein
LPNFAGNRNANNLQASRNGGAGDRAEESEQQARPIAAISNQDNIAADQISQLSEVQPIPIPRSNNQQVANGGDDPP